MTRKASVCILVAYLPYISSSVGRKSQRMDTFRPPRWRVNCVIVPGGPGNRMSPRAVIRGGVLTFTAVDATDEGEYTCKALNTHGEHTARVSLIVQSMCLRRSMSGCENIESFSHTVGTTAFSKKNQLSSSALHPPAFSRTYFSRNLKVHLRLLYKRERSPTIAISPNNYSPPCRRRLW